MKRPMPFGEHVEISSDSDAEDKPEAKAESKPTEAKVESKLIEAEGESKPAEDKPESKLTEDKPESKPTDDKQESMPSCISFEVPPKPVVTAEALLRKAGMYQEYMSCVPIPKERGSVIPCNSWTGLAWSIKQLYGQPLHYLTNIRLREMDRMRFGTPNEDVPLDELIDPVKAELTIWNLEEVHRTTASPDHLAELWKDDEFYHMYIDRIFPTLPLE